MEVSNIIMHPLPQMTNKGERKMKNIKKILCVVLAIVCVAAAFAGCSSKSNDDSKDKAKSSSTAKVKVIDIELSSEEYAFGVDKNQPELKEKCNELLKEMKSNGELDKISNKAWLQQRRTTARTSLLLQQTQSLSLLNTKRATSSTALIWKSQIFLLKSSTRNL